MSFFYTPGQALEAKNPAGRRIQLGGLVQAGSVVKHPDGRVQFVVADLKATAPVEYQGDLPDLFREGQGIVAEGKFDSSGVFHAEQVLGEVCKALRVDISELMGRGRHPRVVLARSITAHLSRRLTTMSYPEIARAMNRPNHSTVITACKRLAGAMERNEKPSPTLELGVELAGLSISDLCDHLSRRVERAAAG